MIIYAHCGGCGTRCQPVGFAGAAGGWLCAECYTYGTCHDCDRVMPKALLKDMGDGYVTCEDCVEEVAARQMLWEQQEETTCDW